MARLRIITRALVFDNDKILLARNKSANFWYPPGGGWEFDSESIKESVAREVTEETGYQVDVDNLLWVREFREPEKDKVSLETFWLTHISEDNQQTEKKLSDHIDHDVDGAVEECRWFAITELEDIKILPKFIKERLADSHLENDAFVDG